MESAEKIAASGVKYYIEVANMPTTNDALNFLRQQKHMIVAPSKAVNAGGVGVSALEMAQNSERLVWTADEVDAHVPGVLCVLVDGLPVVFPQPSRNLVKGDAKSLFIAAASILAKTARDADCLRLERLYPGYGFAVHKGNPTPAHLAALRRLGPCPEHRRSFGPVRQMELF